MLSINYRPNDRRAELRWTEGVGQAPWIEVLRRLLFDHSDSAVQEDGFTVSLPWWNFIALRSELLELFRGYNLKFGEAVKIGSEAAELLRQSRLNAESYVRAGTGQGLDQAGITKELEQRAFVRRLSPEQMRNVVKMVALPAAATFSVPGAGKTTEALAFFFCQAPIEARLLVVAPKNAFAAWDEELGECMPHLRAAFTRLRGGKESIALMLGADPHFMVISYQQLVRVSDIVAAHCAQFPTYVFLDESHRIKSGAGKQTARAALSLSHLPIGKLIMSGTPMPQSTEDLVPQFSFLYPEIEVNSENVVDLIRPIYVRTNKKELGLPPVTRQLVQLPMAPIQHELYRLMKSEVARDAASALSIRSKQAFRSLGRSVARLLQFVSNPSLLSADIGFAHADLLSAVLSEGEGPKLRYVLKRARTLARENKKVLIWTSFVRNVEYIASRLADLGAVYIHGGVDAGDENDDDTREGKIKLFHDDPTVRIMVANPAAASEGISLHRICHHAIYLDRTFNAAHYLQSEDRIHRFGLAANQETTIEIVECTGSVDETVRGRLSYKIGRMAEALEDSSLSPDPIPLDPNDIEDADEYTTGLVPDDVHALLKHLKEGVQ